MCRTLDDAKVARGATTEIAGNGFGGRRHDRLVAFNDELPLSIVDFDSFLTFGIQPFCAVVGLFINPAFLYNILSPGQKRQLQKHGRCGKKPTSALIVRLPLPCL